MNEAATICELEHQLDDTTDLLAQQNAKVSDLQVELAKVKFRNAELRARLQEFQITLKGKATE